jgi:hypothetical protein
VKASLQKIPLFLFSCLIACGGETLDVGSDGSQEVAIPPPADTGSGGSVQTPAGKGGVDCGTDCVVTTEIVAPPGPDVPLVEDWADPSACTAAADSAISGTWRGYVQGSNLPDEGTVVLNVTGTSDGRPCGRVTFGQGDPPAAATDGDAPYPLGTADNHEAMEDLPKRAYAGLPYTMLSASWNGERLLFDVGFAQILESWCPLQTPHWETGFEPHAYLCLPLWGGGYEPGEFYHLLNPYTGETVEVSASRWAYCHRTNIVCACDAERCVASRDANLASFDLRIQGNEAEGTFDGLPVLFRREE